jgi:hypothetical protein
MRAFWAATLAFTFAFIGWFAFAPLMTVVRKDIGLCDNDAEVQLDIENANCICKKGCKQTLGNAQMASVSFDVFTRFMMGSVIETLGPKNADVIFVPLWSSVLRQRLLRHKWHRLDHCSLLCVLPRLYIRGQPGLEYDHVQQRGSWNCKCDSRWLGQPRWRPHTDIAAPPLQVLPRRPWA